MKPGLNRAAWPLLLLPASLLPDLGAAIPGAAYYFRDFSMTFYPQRVYFAKEVLAGRWPFWNPLLYEGSAFLPFYYPVDLLHLVSATPGFVSWLLTLHFPLAAAAMYVLARDLGASRPGSFVAGSLYACGGLALSSLSLFIFLEALAWAPAVALLLRRAALSGGRQVALAALATAVAVSTLAVEFAAQAALLGGLLGLLARPDLRGMARLALAAGLGALLAALPMALTLGIVGESLRGAGIPPFELLQRSVHPLTLLQVVVSDAFGPPAQPLQFLAWGRLFADGSPYFTSYYLGPVAVALAGAGLGALGRRARVVVGLLLLAALAYAIGRHFPLAPALAPWVRVFRFPAKALLLPYLITALLAGLGVSRIQRGEGARALLACALVLAALVGAAGLGVALTPERVTTWLGADPAAMELALPLVWRSAALAVALVLLSAGLALAGLRGRVAPARGAALLGLLALADVARAGIGVNPRVPGSFYELLPEIRRELHDLAPLRIFSYPAGAGPTMNALLAQHSPGIHLRAFHLLRQLETPFANLLDGIASVEGIDRHGFVPNPQALRYRQFDPALADAAVVDALRNASVARVLSLDFPQHEALRLRAQVPTGLPGTTIQVYELEAPWPRDYVACRVHVEPDLPAAQGRSLDPGFDPWRDVALETPAQASCRAGRVLERSEAPGDQRYLVELDGDGLLVMRDSFTPSWRARVHGRAASVLRANGRHRAVALPPGRHEVQLRYHPPGLRSGLFLSALGALVTVVVLVRPLRGAR
jgi:hypothetical protein